MKQSEETVHGRVLGIVYSKIETSKAKQIKERQTSEQSSVSAHSASLNPQVINKVSTSREGYKSVYCYYWQTTVVQYNIT